MSLVHHAVATLSGGVFGLLFWLARYGWNGGNGVVGFWLLLAEFLVYAALGWLSWAVVWRGRVWQDLIINGFFLGMFKAAAPLIVLPVLKAAFWLALLPGAFSGLLCALFIGAVMETLGLTHSRKSV